jgi:hypothetical protein
MVGGIGHLYVILLFLVCIFRKRRDDNGKWFCMSSEDLMSLPCVYCHVVEEHGNLGRPCF